MFGAQSTREEFVRDRTHSWEMYREQYSYYLGEAPA
jgi:hypothetical protein